MPSTKGNGKKTKMLVLQKKTKVQRAPRLNGPLYNHMRMVVDPCNAPLADSCYPNAQGVLRSRIRKVNVSSHTPASTPATYARVLAWHPVLGAYNLGNGNNAYPTASVGTLFFPNATLSRYGASGSSGSAVYSARAISGCLSMAWNENELSRKGTIYSGVVSGSIIYQHLDGTAGGGAGFTISANHLISMLAASCRVPNDKCEVTWVPTEFDANYTDPASVAAAPSIAVEQYFNKTNFVVLVWIGAQAVNETVGLVESCVSITEENPFNNVGGPLVQDAAHVNTSGVPNAVTKIVSALQSRDPSWYINTAKKLGSLGVKVLSAYARGGALGMVSEMAGLALAPRRNVAA